MSQLYSFFGMLIFTAIFFVGMVAYGKNTKKTKIAYVCWGISCLGGCVIIFFLQAQKISHATDTLSADSPPNIIYAASNNFFDNGDGTITDHKTGLIWEKQEKIPLWGGKAPTWGQALLYCKDLSFGGHKDWHLPSVQELVSLVDYNRIDPAIDSTFFPGTKCSVFSDYWSSTTYLRNKDKAWAVSFASGLVLDFNKNQLNFVRCVKNISSSGK